MYLVRLHANLRRPWCGLLNDSWSSVSFHLVFFLRGIRRISRVSFARIPVISFVIFYEGICSRSLWSSARRSREFIGFEWRGDRTRLPFPLSFLHSNWWFWCFIGIPKCVIFITVICESKARHVKRVGKS